MKKFILFMLIYTLVFATIIPCSVFAASADYIIAEEAAKFVSEKDRVGLEISGFVPQLKYTASPTVQGTVNLKVRNFVQEVIKNAKKSNYSRKISFFYKDYSNTTTGNIVSCSVTASVTSSTTKNYETAFTVDLKTPKPRVLTLENVLNSKNAMPIVNTIINNSIANHPDKFNITEKKDPENDNFYIENNYAKVIYNNYTFSIRFGSIKDFTLDKNYYSKETFDLKMIPLRTVCEQFGYTITYNGRTKSISIEKGDFETSIKIGENSYYTDIKRKRTLDASPELSRGVTYVPITFFEQILGIYYKIENKEITFSQYIG